MRCTDCLLYTSSSLDYVNLKDYAIKVGVELVQEDEYAVSDVNI